MSAISTQSRTIVVAVESGAEWRFNLRPDGVDLVMIAQVSSEAPLAFARRFLGRLVKLIDDGADVVSAALAVSSAFDLRRLEARCVMVRAILRTLRSDANSQLLLVEPTDATPDCRRHLTAIAEGLLEGAAIDSQIRISYVSGSGSSTAIVSAHCCPSSSLSTALDSN
jgi:hypothetical protein